MGICDCGFYPAELTDTGSIWRSHSGVKRLHLFSVRCSIAIHRRAKSAFRSSQRREAEHDDVGVARLPAMKINSEASQFFVLNITA